MSSPPDSHSQHHPYNRLSSSLSLSLSHTHTHTHIHTQFLILAHRPLFTDLRVFTNLGCHRYVSTAANRLASTFSIRFRHFLVNTLVTFSVAFFVCLLPSSLSNIEEQRQEQRRSIHKSPCCHCNPFWCFCTLVFANCRQQRSLLCSFNKIIWFLY